MEGKYYWIKDETFGWLPGKILDQIEDKFKFEVRVNNQTEVRYALKSNEYQEVHPSCLEGVDDLLMLGDFNQQTLLHNTRERFSDNRIYTFIGSPILIAVNPYKSLNIYSDSDINAFKDYFYKLNNNAAYQDMILEKKNQSIIISGESGSGKTQSTKIILRFLAVSSILFDKKNNIKQDESIVTVEKQVLDSNPLLEAFGNAKTVKNNNSSRFGKFIQVNFTEHGKIISAKIYNYLLEKSRVVQIQEEERNYHIFYQLLKGANEAEIKKYYVKEIEYFEYLNKGNSFDVEETDDAEDFLQTKDCMLKLKFKPEEINIVLQVVMGVLYLGNIVFIEGQNNSSEIDEESQEDLKIAAELLGLTTESLVKILTSQKFTDLSTKKIIEKKYNVEKARMGRDALAKAIYSKMFDWIVKKINAAIANADSKDQKNEKNRRIGILDIFGFENFDQNSFEQLCINYANERLQQFFNHHIFKMEQNEYREEKIDYSSVEFMDNKDIIDLIDNEKSSIFKILDSEGITPKRDDNNFKNVVYKIFGNHNKLAEDIEGYIGVQHYAGEVFYDVNGFIDKNMDQLSNDINDAMELSKNKLLNRIFKADEEPKKKGAKDKKNDAPKDVKINKIQSDTISTQFKRQLDELIKMLNASNPRYVKCIKPNSIKKPIVFDSIDVSLQLLSAGVLEAVKIRKAGYSVRRTKEEFVKRYIALTGSININNYKSGSNVNFNDLCKEMFNVFLGIEDMKAFFVGNKKLIQIGLTKIFMKEEVKNILEFKLNRVKFQQLLQNNIRRWLVYKKVRGILQKRLQSRIKISKIFRGFKLRKKLNLKKLRSSSKILKRSIKFFIKRKKIFLNLKLLALEGLEIKIQEKKKREKELAEEKKRIEQEKKEKIERLEQEKRERDKTEKSNAPLNSNPVSAKETSTKEDNSFDNNNISIIKQNVRQSEQLGVEDVSTLQIINDLNFKTEKKAGGRKKKTNIEDLYLSSGLDKVTEKTFLEEIKQLKLDLEQSKTDKEKLNAELANKNELIINKDKEIEVLKQKCGISGSYNLSSEFDNLGSKIQMINNEMEDNKTKFHEKSFANVNAIEEANDENIALIKKLKNELCDKESDLSILSMRIEQFTRLNDDLNEQNNSLQEQISKRKGKMEGEMNQLYDKIKDLELAKMNLERQVKDIGDRSMTDDVKLDMNVKSILGNEKDYSVDKKLMADTKRELKETKKSIEEIKSRYEKELSSKNYELRMKDLKLDETDNKLVRLEDDLKIKVELLVQYKTESEICREKIQEMKVKLENLDKTSKLLEYEKEITKTKAEFERTLKKKDNEINEYKEASEKNLQIIERMKKMETALKTELTNKDNELSKRQNKINALKMELEKFEDDIIVFKKEILNLKAKNELMEVDMKNKYEQENKIKSQEIGMYKEKIKKYDKYINDMKELLKKKQNIIDMKKKMNFTLVELCKIKKTEVSVLESVKAPNTSNTIKETLVNIKSKEEDILKKLSEISANPENTDSEEEGEDEDDEEGDSENSFN